MESPTQDADIDAPNDIADEPDATADVLDSGDASDADAGDEEDAPDGADAVDADDALDAGPDAPAHCFDKTTNESETDTDCGGECKPCGKGDKCLENTDCESGTCKEKKTCQ